MAILTVQLYPWALTYKPEIFIKVDSQNIALKIKHVLLALT